MSHIDGCDHVQVGRPENVELKRQVTVREIVSLNSHSFSLEVLKAETLNGEVDHLKFSYIGEELTIPEGHLSSRCRERRSTTLSQGLSRS
ncbi:hypothetical protein SADUNF_Sadunf16G0269000 [Salix dunnii]|uniref:Uncharacterized protein n=1 Tax=Salix dunnii TaxID=1413687 RepID=A0A835JDJ3_9ROSI|nr:hypothetical protein SADUNF_Sadunf16G0269000 [Salix dunnii]